MNWVDILLGVVVLIAIVSGWNRGFILGCIDLINWTVSLVAAYIFYPYTANFLDTFLTTGAWKLPVSFLSTALVARLLIGLITRYIVRAVPEDANQHTVNKFLGIIPGAVNGWVYAIIFSALLLSLPLKDSVTNETRKSRYAGKLAMQSEWVNRKLTPVFGDAIRQTMNRLTVSPSSHESVALPFKYDRSITRAELEGQMPEMVNKERTSRGLKPVLADPELTRVARAQSADMFVRGYFAHINPDGKNPFDRMKEANIKFYNAGENLALAPTLEIAHTNLMNSRGHKANILNTGFGRLGIGILDGGYYGLMISQEFRD